MRQAKIYRKETLAGMLTEDGGNYTFIYDSAYLASPSPVAISLTHALNMGFEISQLSLNISVHSAHFLCRNARNSIYEVRRKSLSYRGFPPNSL